MDNSNQQTETYLSLSIINLLIPYDHYPGDCQNSEHTFIQIRY